MSKDIDYLVGSYGTEEEPTIHWIRFNQHKESFSKVCAVKGILNPSFLTTDQNDKYLFAVSELAEGEVVSYEIDYEKEELIEISRQPTLGGPCFVEVTEDNKFLLTANFGNGSVIVHPIKEGKLQKHTDYINYMDEAKSKGYESSNVHAIRYVPHTKTFIATDLGANCIRFYKLSKLGELEEVNYITLPAGSGPRHVDFHPEKNNLYIVNEFNSTVCVYRYNENATHVEHVQTIKTIDDKQFKEENYCADIHVTQSGNYVLASNRGHHSITSFKIEEDGSLKEVMNYKLKGDWPRNFTITQDDQFVIVANEHTNDLELLILDGSGKLSTTDTTYNIQKPVCLKLFNKSKKQIKTQ